MQPPSAHVKELLTSLLSYCRSNDWAGWDPYDGLSSPLLGFPLLKNRYARLVVIQLNKRSVFNLRPLLGVPREQNPKGIALFASAITRLAQHGMANISEAATLLSRLLELRSKGWEHFCWGYNFDWQTRYYLVPRFSPNIICTTFAANALLDGYEATGDKAYLDAAQSAGQFVVEKLNRTREGAGFCFSYTTLDNSRIHNANLLGAALLARLSKHTGSAKHYQVIQESTQWSVERIRPDGSWPYGEGPKQSWVDSFHTGYNLVALKTIRDSIQDNRLEPVITVALDYYLKNFFEPQGVVKYYHNNRYPIDAHAAAHAIVTLSEFSNTIPDAASKASRICEWMSANMRSADGWFFYQKHPTYTVRIPYMRWCQAWMLLGLTSFLSTFNSSRRQSLNCAVQISQSEP